MTEAASFITAKYRVVTPMFLSGADQDKAEFRLASFKGALRFWWRALAASQYPDIQQLREAEDSLFGSTRTGVSRVRLRLEESEIKIQTINKFSRNSWQSYIGYGLIDKPGQSIRQGIEPGSWFAVKIMTKQVDESLLVILRQALMAVGLFGGLGSRARNGWGSLTLLSLVGGGSEWHAPEDQSRLEEEIKTLLKTQTAIQNWTTFNKQGGFLIGEMKDTNERAHQWLAQKYQNFTKSLTEKSSREGLGLPRKSAGKNQSVRSASSIFLHIHQTEKSWAMPIALFLPAQFLEHQAEPSGGWRVAKSFVTGEVQR